MDEPGMVSMFQALVASGLQGFLGCTAVVYEEALVEFFANGRVRDGLVISSVDGVFVEISEDLFPETFELLVDGLRDLSEIPKDAIFDARSIVSFSGEPISLSGRKNQMKFEFHLLCDIMAKAISVKAGSFNAITIENFSLMTAVVCSVRMNWAKILFSILKKMVTPGSKQAKGFAIQISLLLATIPTLELDGAEEVTGAAKKRAVLKKRPAANVGAAVPKKKRTIKKKSVSSLSTLEMVAVAEEAVPIQQVAEPSAVEEIRYPSADDVDLIIQQVLDETRAVDAPADKDQPAVSEEKLWYDLPYDDLVAKWEAERPVVTASDTDEELATMDVAPADGDQQVQESVDPISYDDMLSADERMSLDDILLTIPVDIPLPSSSMEITKIMMGKSIKIPGVTKWTWFLKSLPCIPSDDKGKEILVEKDPIRGNPAREHYFLICADIDLLVELRAKGSPRDRGAIIARNNTDDTLPTLVEPVSKISPSRSPVFAFRVSQFCSIFVDFSLFNWIPSADISEFLSSVALDRTVLRSVQSSQNSFSIAPSVQLSLDQHQSSSSSTDSSSSLRFDQTDVDATASSLPHASQDLSAALADLQNASIFTGLADVRQEVQAVNAKVDIMASRLNAIQKDAEATKEALSHQLLEFQSSAQENHSVLHAQLSELVDYIHRGGADKKGESGSRGIQQPLNVQVSASAERTPTFAQRVEMAQRYIVHTVLDADANRALFERQDAAERDRERRRREARALKRRRRD
ncbi:hypothetical protein F511_43043 [Dorcoceras hygrometricum]|uniref:Dystroglycan-like n=1 Tax=Dorcoceras hygrometricum TaxID=472368 RepID=A0A2Z7D0J3_9LAMI|nr:hypothetical protein F511_43043 [Dorcoceras hygrometricum]